MLKLPYILSEIDSKILETDDIRRTWYPDNPYHGVRVVKIADDRRQLDELTASCYFTLPKRTTGRVSLLTIARGRPGEYPCMPSFWDPTELEDEHGGVYLDVIYDATRELFEVRKNVGGVTSELVGVILEGATPERVCGQVLEFYVEISQGRIFAAIHNRFANGDLRLTATSSKIEEAQKPCHQPWGASPAGHWWLFSGLAHVIDNRAMAMPTGFGLSNLRVTLAAETEEAVGSLLYKGELDHLVDNPPKGTVKNAVRALNQHAKDLRGTATGIECIRLMLPLPKEPAAESEIKRDPVERDPAEPKSFDALEAAAARDLASGSAKACVAAIEEMVALEDLNID